MQRLLKFRAPAIFCAAATLACELMSRPYSGMGICDDGAYIHMAKTLANTGQIVYNGWEAAMLVWQLYLGAAFIKLFGFSLTTVRMGTVVTAMVSAFLLQRILVRANISERNATVGTLALVLSPLFLMLSATYMTDIYGLFAVIVCLYGCLRALQSATSRAAIGWLCFAVVANALCGTSRQIAWLGTLVMVPSALWLLRDQRRVFVAGVSVTLAGVGFIFLCREWFMRQPYSVPYPMFPPAFSGTRVLPQLQLSCMDIPFLLFPIVALFLPVLRRVRPRTLWVFSILVAGYLLVALYPSHLRGSFTLEPVSGTVGDWSNAFATFSYPGLQGRVPLFLQPLERVLLTIATFGGVAGLIKALLPGRPASLPSPNPSMAISWNGLAILLLPFGFAYALLLLPAAATYGIHDRYFLAPLVVALIFVVGVYQERVRFEIPFAGIFLVGASAAYSIVCTHHMFAFYRARTEMAAELHSAGVPDTAIDNGWEHNQGVELQIAGHLNYPLIQVPANVYTPVAAFAASSCPMSMFQYTPHVRPLYAISFDPDACYGLAPFAPIHYSRWPYAPGTLYVVRSLPPER